MCSVTRSVFTLLSFSFLSISFFFPPTHPPLALFISLCLSPSISGWKTRQDYVSVGLLWRLVCVCVLDCRGERGEEVDGANWRREIKKAEESYQRHLMRSLFITVGNSLLLLYVGRKWQTGNHGNTSCWVEEHSDPVVWQKERERKKGKGRESEMSHIKEIDIGKSNWMYINQQVIKRKSERFPQWLLMKDMWGENVDLEKDRCMMCEEKTGKVCVYVWEKENIQYLSVCVHMCVCVCVSPVCVSSAYDWNLRSPDLFGAATSNWI